MRIYLSLLLLLIEPAVHAQADVHAPFRPSMLYPKKEYASTLVGLADALLKRQNRDPRDANEGGIWCEFCKVWHTRAAESVYPFAVSYAITGDRKYLTAAERAAAWLVRQQEPNGSWKETPEEWTGTTTDQLLMMMLAYEKIAGQLDTAARASWSGSMEKAAAYLAAVMRPEFASINYVATTTATLAKAGLLFKNNEYLRLAHTLAHRVVSKMDEDGFLDGEGGRSYNNNKMGVDLGYEMEMSLWGLGLYARLTKDSLVDGYVKRSLKNHLFFIYPDGSLDASWGIRSNKWTGYGGATSDGCQLLFTLYADEDPRYATASLRNLAFLRTCKWGDLIGYGPQHGEVFARPPCIYPTFAKAKNLAMAYEWETRSTRPAAALPSDKTGWLKVFPTLDLVEVRTENFMATITGYRYKDPAGTKGKYMYRPTGGAVSHLWMKGQGFLQASSPTVYTRPEPMSFPEAPGVVTLTPRIEYTDSIGTFTNLYEYDSRITARAVGETDRLFFVDVTGELKDKNFLTGGVRYKMEYAFGDRSFEKTIQLTYHDAWPVIRIIEPFIDYKGMTVEKKDAFTIVFTSPGRELVFSLVSGNAELMAGRDASHYWTPYPALRALPIELVVSPPAKGFTNTVRYRVTIVEKKAGKNPGMHFY